MNTEEIENLVSALGYKVVSLDQLPQIKSNKEELFIINTEKINSGVVGHWILLAKQIIGNKPVIIYLDSLSIPPILKNIIMYINVNIGDGDLICNKLQLQGEESATCGEFCVMLAVHLNNKLSYDSFLHTYRFTPKINDKMIGEQFAKYKKERGV